MKILRALALTLGLAFVHHSAAQAPRPGVLPGQTATALADGTYLLLGGSASGAASRNASLVDRAGAEARALGAGPAYARTGHSATLLPDGTVLIFGGRGADGALVETAEVFSPATASFASIANLGLLSRAGHSAIALTDGRILFVGGADQRNAPLPVAELWDPRAGAVSSVSRGADFDRRNATATLLPDGSVLLSGGETATEGAAGSALVFRPDVESFVAIGKAQANALLMAASNQAFGIADSLPASESANFPADGLLAVRFSRPVELASVNDASIVLIGPGGTVSARAVPSQDGMIAFLSPSRPLFPGARYTLFVDGVVAASGEALALQAIGFDTARLDAGASITMLSRPNRAPASDRHAAIKSAEATADKPSANEGADDADEAFLPDARHHKGRWFTGRALPDFVRSLRDHEGPFAERVKTRRARHMKVAYPPLYGGSGVAGHVLRLNDRPLRNATVSIGALQTKTDARGRFELLGVPIGRQELVVNGMTAGGPGREFAQVVIGVEVQAGKVTEVPHAIYLPRIRAQDWFTLDSPTAAERVLKHPAIPGMEVHIPPGTVLRDRNGAILTRIAIVPTPMDRTPYPTPANFPGYFLLHPGGATVHGLTPGLTQGVRIVYPNLNNDAPGTLQQLWFYDPMRGGWFVYGTARVSADGAQIMPDSGAVFYEAMGFSFHPIGGSPPPPSAPPPGSCAKAGDPVDCSTGLFLHTRTDVFIPDVIPINVTRTYRPGDVAIRAFGFGTSHEYGLYLAPTPTFPANPILVLPDGSRINFDLIGSDVWQHTGTPTRFQHARIEKVLNGSGWVFPNNTAYKLTLKDKSVFYFMFGAPSSLLGMEDRNGNRLHFSTSAGRVDRITSQNGRYVDFVYDASNRVSQIRDVAERTWTYQYTAAGYLERVTYPDATFEEYTYDGANRMQTVKDRRGNIMVTNSYDANGRVRQQTLADSAVYQFAYTLNGAGKVIRTEITDPRNHVRRVDFNADGYVTSNTYAVGTTDEQTFTEVHQAGSNLLLSVTDPLGRKTSYTYDARNNVASVTRMADTTEAATESFTYDPIYNQLTSRTDPLDRTTTFTYDSFGNLVKVIDPLNNEARLTYNAAGQPASLTNGVNKTARFAYDMGDLVQITDPLGRVIQRFADVLGRLAAQTDPSGNRTVYEYDAIDRVRKITDAAGRATVLAYDGEGNLTSVRDANNGLHLYAFDARNRLSSYTDPLGKSELYLHDGLGNLVSFTDRRLQITTFDYDARDRRSLATYADNSTISYAYDTAGRLTQASDSLTGAIVRGYDNFDRLTSETAPAGSLTYTYDAAGLRRSMTVSGQAQVTYGYDDADRITSIAQGSSAVQLAYDNAHRRTTLTLPNGVVASYGYNDASELTSIAYARGATTLGDLNYTYDAAGRRIRVSGSMARTGFPAAMTTATYDAANRQTSWNGTALTYDDNGSMLSDGTRTYTWDARNRLVGVAGAGNASFAYDAFGRRSSKSVDGAATQFLYDGLNPVQERSNGGPVANMLTGPRIDEIFRRSDVDGSRDLLVDALGSTLALTDASGTVRTALTYEPYGETIATGEPNSTSYRYTGRENDGTGLIYYRARYYDPVLKRFISEDPIGMSGGVNFYGYVGGDPVSYTDPNGNLPVPVITGIIGGLAGGAGYLAGKWLAGGCISGRELAVAIGVGAVQGALAPFVGGIAGAAGLGGAANVAQDAINSGLDGKSMSSEDLAASFGLGAASGMMGGAWKPTSQYRDFRYPGWAAEGNAQRSLNANVGLTNSIRNFLGSAGSTVGGEIGKSCGCP